MSIPNSQIQRRTEGVSFVRLQGDEVTDSKGRKYQLPKNDREIRLNIRSRMQASVTAVIETRDGINHLISFR